MIDAPLSALENACTVILLRDGVGGLETLLLARTSASRAFAGAWVFPGGKVDPEDYLPENPISNNAHQPGDCRGTEENGSDPDDSDPNDSDPNDSDPNDSDPNDSDPNLCDVNLCDVNLAAAQRAGIREVEEETGQQLSGHAMIPLSVWVPMQRIPRRFRTWFFLAPAQPGTIELSPQEHESYAWLSPREALDRHAQGLMKLVIPTWLTLFHLKEFESVQHALTAAQEGGQCIFNTRVLPFEANHDQNTRPTAAMWHGDEDYPTANGETQTTKGSRHRVNISTLPWTFERSH